MQHSEQARDSDTHEADQSADRGDVRADLHSHTTASDGALSPEDLMQVASSRGLTHLAVSDHDTTASLERARAAGEAHGVELIPATELTCTYQNQTIHMLGYGIDPDNPSMREFCEITRDLRETRYREMIELLRKQRGLEDLSDEEAWPGTETSSLCRPQLAAALVEHGYASDVQEVFDNWLGDSGVAFVSHRALPAQRAMEAIHNAGGVAVIAHCGKYRSGIRVTRELLGQGMDGIEVLHPDHGEKIRNRLIRECERKGCLFTGGSDFHDPNHRKGSLFGRITIGEKDLNALLAACAG